jgi:hypothetical protein
VAHPDPFAGAGAEAPAVSQRTPEKLRRRARRKAKSARWFRRIVQERLEKWLPEGKLEIVGVAWELAPHVRRVYDALRVDLAPWVLGTKDIPALRHPGHDRLMHALGRLSMAKVLLAMSLFADYRSNIIGVPYQDEHTGQWHWAGRSIEVIAKAAGVSYWACKRRVDWIVKRDLMSRFQQAGTDFDGEKYGRPSIRSIKDATLWKAIGERTAQAVKFAASTSYRLWMEAQERVRPVVEALKRVRQQAAAAMDARAENLRRPRSRPVGIGEAIQQLLAGLRPSYLPKPAPP